MTNKTLVKVRAWIKIYVPQTENTELLPHFIAIKWAVCHLGIIFNLISVNFGRFTS